ncbi:hypothetical protein [Geminocystis sp. NIES-3709]|uniref:hypothetical protein n=1 Tax=Geminocystis sp. NIES-3709 TaxID=1617448 RepID=UPI0005FC7AC9|nr:hypothetical protein [Geminocystis sp. NIES-3709]BAQ65504.1 hypothetical protein GM3709_2269 [Geminocystis sp. NIES-3709]
MNRLAPKTDTLKPLFAKSGNQCAFPKCQHPLFNHKGQFIAQVCHIEGASEGGERYNPNTDDEYRRSYDNLLILCYAHHVETDDVKEFPVEKLRQMKKEHESKFESLNFHVEKEDLQKIVDEMNQYWDDIERLNKVDHKFFGTELEMEIDVKKNFLALVDDIKEEVDAIENLLKIFADSDQNLLNDLEQLLKKKNIDISIFDDVPYYENSFFNRNWEEHNLGSHNWIKRLRIDLLHLEIKYLELQLILNNDEIFKDRLIKAKNIFQEYAQKAIHID